MVKFLISLSFLDQNHGIDLNTTVEEKRKEEKCMVVDLKWASILAIRLRIKSGRT